MLIRVVGFLFGPFFYPVYFASFLHVVDFFANIAAPKSINSETKSPLPQRPYGAFRIATCSETRR